MEPRIYTTADCIGIDRDFSPEGKVIVIDKNALPVDYHNQLFFCAHDHSHNPRFCRPVSTVSLSDGETMHFWRDDVVGALKPELLPESAKLHLSQIRPPNALPLECNEPKYSGYSFLPDGRYTSGVWLCSEKEVMDYIEIQQPYQHRIMICDRDDFAVLEMQEGKLLYPNEEAMEAFRQQEQAGGMTMT